MKRSDVAWLLAGVLLAACHTDSEKKPAPVMKAQPQPAPVVEKAATPAPPPEESSEMAKTLLGLNAKPSALAAAPKPMKRPKSLRLAKEEEVDMSSYPVEPHGLSDHQFQQAIDDWDGFRNCLAMAAYRNGRNAENGALKVQLEIEQSGAVVRSRVMESKSPELAECVASRSKKIRFPAFAGIDRVTKEAKFIF
jgi:hypothetical protein